jgi:hypothetical protein
MDNVVGQKHFFFSRLVFSSLSPSLKGHFELAPRVASEWVFAQAFYFSLTWKIKEKTPGKYRQIHLLSLLSAPLINPRTLCQANKLVICCQLNCAA